VTTVTLKTIILSRVVSTCLMPIARLISARYKIRLRTIMPSGNGEFPCGSENEPAPRVTPEPASLVLAGAGFLPLRKRRNKAEQSEIVNG